MEVKHETCLYVIDHIYFDNASTNLYHLFLHCDICGKPIKLCVRTENNIIKWLGDAKAEKVCKNCDYYFYGQCYGQKNAPKVDANEVHNCWTERR